MNRPEQDDLAGVSYSNMMLWQRNDLVIACMDRGLSTNGSKAVIANRLIRHCDAAARR